MMMDFASALVWYHTHIQTQRYLSLSLSLSIFLHEKETHKD